MRERIGRLTKKDASHPDIPVLNALKLAVEAINPDDVSKLNEPVIRQSLYREPRDCRSSSMICKTSFAFVMAPI